MGEVLSHLLNFRHLVLILLPRQSQWGCRRRMCSNGFCYPT